MPVRLSRRDGTPDRLIKAHEIGRIGAVYVVESYSGEGYYYLQLPFEWDDAGVPVARWADDASTSYVWVVDWESRPRLGSL